MTDQTLALRANGAVAQADQWSNERIDLIKRTIAKDATDDELALFLQVCKRTGLDPFAKQVYAIFRWDKAAGRKVMSIQFGIDGLRLMAERTGQYGGSETHWCGPDGEWTDVWTDVENPPFAARTSVWKVGVARPFTAVCRFASYQQNTSFWRDAPDNQIAKCSEGLALRKAFPADLAGYRQVAPDLDRGGDRIIDRATGEITEDDAYDRVAAEYEANRPAIGTPRPHTSSTTDPHRAPELMQGAVTGAVPLEHADDETRQALAACTRLIGRLDAAGVAYGPLPESPTVDSLRAWYSTSKASLPPVPAQPPLLETPARSAYDEPAPGRGARGR